MEERVLAYKIQLDETPVKSLKLQLREATEEAQRLATQPVVDEEALAAAIQRTAELKDAMADVNEQVAVFASGSKYEQVNNALGQMKDAIFALDFGKASERATAFARAAKSITFKDAIESVSQLGSTFIQVGKALLTNPLFLLAAVIIGIVVVIYKLLDALGVIKVVMEAVGKVVDSLVGMFYALTDAMGLTSKAAEEEAKATIEANNAKAESSKEYYSQFESAISNQLRLMKASEDGTKKSTDEIIQKERELLFIKRHSAKVQAQLAESTLNALLSSGKATKEEIESQRQKVLELRQAFQNADTDMKVFDLEQQKRAKKAAEADAKTAADQAKKAAENRKKIEEQKRQIEEQTAKFIQSLDRAQEDRNIALIADEIEREKQRQLIALERRRQDIDFSKMTAEAKLRFDIEYFEEKDRIEQEASAKEKQRIEDGLQAQIDAIQAQKDAELKAIQETEAMREEARKQEKDALVAAQFATLTTSAELFDQLAGLAEQGSAAQKIAALGSILASQAEAIAKAVPVALEASKATGPAAPFVFASTLIGIGASIVASITKAKQILSSSPAGGSVSGGGGGGGASIPRPSFGQAPSTPSINLSQGQNQTANLGLGYNMVSVVDYTDIQQTGNRVKLLENAVSLGL